MISELSLALGKRINKQKRHRTLSTYRNEFMLQNDIFIEIGKTKVWNDSMEFYATSNLPISSLPISEESMKFHWNFIFNFSKIHWVLRNCLCRRKWEFNEIPWKQWCPIWEIENSIVFQGITSEFDYHNFGNTRNSMVLHKMPRNFSCRQK